MSTFANDYVAPGGGTEADISKLSTVLNLPTDATLAIMNCGGQGVRSSGRRSGADETAAASALDPSMMNVWGDFMSEEMDSAPAASAPAAASSASKPAAASSSNDGPSAAAGITTAQRVAAASSEDPSSGSRDYVLPIQPRMRLVGKGKKSSNDDNENDVPTPGLLAQTGTLDASV